MAEHKESSVLFSLQELMNLEKSRVLEEEQDRHRRAEAEARAKLEAELRAREAEESRMRAEESRRRDEELRRRLDEAQIEAAKEAEIERRRLEQHHLLEMAALARQRAHEKEIQQIAAARPQGLPRSAMVAAVLAMVAAVFALVFLAFVQPVQAAKDAVQRAQVLAASDDPSQWDLAEGQLAIARDKDPKNPDTLAVADKVKAKRDALKAKKDAAEAEAAANLKALQDKIAQQEIALRDGKSEAERLEARQKLDELKGQLKGQLKGAPRAGAPAAPAKNCKDVPGCPLCPKICK